MASYKSARCSLEFGVHGDYLVFPTTYYLAPNEKVSIAIVKRDRIEEGGESVTPKGEWRTWVNKYAVDPDQCSLRAKHIMDWVINGVEPPEEVWVTPEKTPAKKPPTAQGSGA